MQLCFSTALRSFFLFLRVSIWYSKITFAIFRFFFFHVPCFRRINFLFTLIFNILVNSLLFLNKKTGSDRRVEIVNKYEFCFRPVPILIMHLVRLFFVQIIAYDYAKYNVLNEFILSFYNCDSNGKSVRILQ